MLAATFDFIVLDYLYHLEFAHNIINPFNIKNRFSIFCTDELSTS